MFCPYCNSEIGDYEEHTQEYCKDLIIHKIIGVLETKCLFVLKQIYNYIIKL